jgi:NADH-ubiquinone oxidoreductase chain 1
MESELVSGFFTEHSSVPFVSFFLAEYGSILLMSVLTAILFLGGYNIPSVPLNSLLDFFKDLELISLNIFNNILDIQEYHSNIMKNPIISGILSGITLGTKACFIVFLFIWARASFPRIRYDQLMQFC